MSAEWKLICRIKDIAPLGTRLVPRGLAWQELPGVLLARGADDVIHARLNTSDGRAYEVKVEEGRIYLDLQELSAPASRAEAALAGTYGVAPLVELRL
jgi:nitrite reductase (NADH) small subunit